MQRDIKGIKRAMEMKRWADRKGGFDPESDGFDRSSSYTMASLSDAWLLRLQELGYSPKTVDVRRWTIRPFLRWAHDRDLRRPEQITKIILEGYQRWLYLYRMTNGKPLTVTSQRGRLGSVKLFFGWLCKHNHLSANPAADLELPRKVPMLLPKAFTQDEVNAILNVPDVSDRLGIRDRAILELFYATGIRRAELVKLDVEDLDLSREVLVIRRGKYGKSRMVPVGERAMLWMRKYLEATRHLLESAVHDKALFLTGFGERFAAGSVGNWVRDTIDAANIGRSGTCHIFRHSCATHMLENGADIRIIAQLLGHADLSTTQIYTQMSILQLKEVYARTHPSARVNPVNSDDSNTNPSSPFCSSCLPS